MTARGQTSCGIAHTETGVFVCYPNPAEHAGDGNIATAFHLSAQANAPPGRRIGRYVVLIDDRRVYESRFSIPLERLSIETNVRSPFRSGSHTLHVVVDGTGSAEVSGITFHTSIQFGFCDPFSRVDPRTCVPSSIREPLNWSIGSRARSTGAFSDYLDYLQLYTKNLGSVEADAADTAAIDEHGNLYTASHSSADIEVRKYSREGSLVYDDLVRSCGSGFVSITGITVDNSGHVWVAGNTTACVPTTPNAFESRISKSARPHGFVLLLDTTKVGPASRIFVTYLSHVENQINALRIDLNGNVYLAGETASAQFPHESILDTGERSAMASSARIGFVSALNSAGSALRWSTLLPGARLNALALDNAGNVYITGGMASTRSGGHSDDILIAALSANGHELSYAARFGGSSIDEGRAISTDRGGNWVFVTGATNSADFPARAAAGTPATKVPSPFAIALQPCRKGPVYSQFLPYDKIADSASTAMQPALDAFSATFRTTEGRTWTNDRKPPMFLRAKSACPPSTP